MMTLEERIAKKEAMAAAQVIKDSMTVNQKIAFVNTPYLDLPENLRVGMTKRPQKFNFVKMSNPHLGEQKETFAARLIRYRSKYHLTVEQFASIANEFAKAYGTKVTVRDINSYENYNICPKIDKMTAIAEAMGVSIDYFAGYGACHRRSRNELIEARARKKGVMSVRNGSGYIDPTMSAAMKDCKKPVVKKQQPKKKAEKKPLVYNATPAWVAPEKRRNVL